MGDQGFMIKKIKRHSGISFTGRQLCVPVQNYLMIAVSLGFPGGSDGKQSAWNAGDGSWIPGLRRSPGEGSDNPLQCSCLENSMDREAWQTTVHGFTESDTAKWLTHTHTYTHTHTLASSLLFSSPLSSSSPFLTLRHNAVLGLLVATEMGVTDASSHPRLTSLSSVATRDLHKYPI